MLIYRLLSLILLPLLTLRAVWAVLRGRETWGDLGQRLWPPKRRGVVWIHGASVGELNAARPIIADLTDQDLWITTNTVTGRDTVKQWEYAHVTATLAPLDFAVLARRAVGGAKALIVLENELWPNRMDAAHRAGVPVILLGARISDRSAQRWKRIAKLAQHMLSPLPLVVPQDANSAQNLIALGVQAEVMQPPQTLKSAFAPADSPAHTDQVGFVRTKTILAASTHDGEEAIVLEAFEKARRTIPDLRLILAPRHPARGDVVADLITAAGLTFARRSEEMMTTEPVLLADTLGEMDLWYRAAGLAFIGGSLVDRGGHTPFEPIAYGCPILHGPFVRNFADIYAALDAADAAVAIADADSLSRAMVTHLGDDAIADRARRCVPPADLGPIIAAIKAVIS